MREQGGRLSGLVALCLELLPQCQVFKGTMHILWILASASPTRGHACPMFSVHDARLLVLKLFCLVLSTCTACGSLPPTRGP
jgi:hypothetical protein